MYKIMIADDESIVVDALKFIIERNFAEECVIESAKTGRKVIEMAEYFQPDIVFMDIQMPGINGIEAMREIRKYNDHIIFIVVSAYVKFDYAKEAIGIGVLEYINKPIDKDVIVATLRKAMQKVDEAKQRRSIDLAYKEELDSFAFRRLLERYNKHWTLEVLHYHPIYDSTGKVTDTYLEKRVQMSHRHEHERDSSGLDAVHLIREDSTENSLDKSENVEEKPLSNEFKIYWIFLLLILLFVLLKK